MGHDFLHGIRLLFRHRAYSLTAVLTLALGVGANATVFAVAWQMMLRPLPWPEAERIVQLWNTMRKTGQPNFIAPANYFDFEREGQLFDAIGACNAFPTATNLTGSGDPVELRLRTVLGDYFGVFNTPAIAGRTITPEDVSAARKVIVLSEGFWRRHFGAALHIVGQKVTLDGESYEVIGVMPGAFDVSARPAEGWVPFRITPEHRALRLGFFLTGVGRLKPGVTPAQGRSEVDAIARRAGETHPGSNAQIGATVVPIRDELVGSARGGVLMLAGAAALVLLIACANVTSLQLARVTGRGRELAVRTALGASRGRLIRMLLAESLPVSIAAGCAGLIGGLWTVRALLAAAPPAIDISPVFTFEPIVFVYTVLLAIVSGVLLASVPAWRATRPAAAAALRARSATDRTSSRIRAVLVTAEVALATMLLVSATVLVISMMNVLRVNPGFDASGVMAAHVRLPAGRYDGIEARARFFEQVFERIGGMPGIQTACASNAVPFETHMSMTYVPEGSGTAVNARPLTITHECFGVMGVPLRRGRLFEERESESVAIVSEGFANRAFPGVDPLGRTIRVGVSTGEPLRIIGIVGDVRMASLESRAYAQVYQLATQTSNFRPDTLLVRASGSPAQIVAAIQTAVRETDPLQPVADVRALEAVTAKSLAPRRFTLGLLGAFAVIALLLAAIGVYGLLSELVAQRRAEIGVRMALGARPQEIIRLISSNALAGVSAGIALGLGGAWTLSRLVQGFAYEVSATSPSIYLGAAALLGTAAGVAACVPVRRATRIAPIVALRAD